MRHNRFVITLCGSVKFKQLFFDAAEQLCKIGVVPHTLGLYGDGKLGYIGDDNSLRAVLEDIHFCKIDDSDGILVINAKYKGDHYIGKSTQREIDYAKKRRIGVYYYSNGLDFCLHQIEDDHKIALMNLGENEAIAAEMQWSERNQ